MSNGINRAWPRRALREILEICSGQIDPRNQPYCSMIHVGSDNIEPKTGRLFGMETAGTLALISGKFPFDSSMVLYSKIRPYLNKVATPDFTGICSADIYPLRPAPGLLDRRFLAYILRQKDFLDFAEAYSARTSIPKINREALGAYEAPVPPLDEQRQIVAVLDKADAILRKRQEAITLTEQLLRSTFLEMFGDPVTNPKRWPLVRLEELGTLDRGRSQHRPRNDPALLGGSHPLIQTGDVANCCGIVKRFSQSYSDIGLAQSKKWPAGTLCITIAANIAKTGILGFDACFPDSVVGFQASDKITNEYIQEWMAFLQPYIEAKADQVAQKNINLEVLRSLDIPVPNKQLLIRHQTAVRSICHLRSRFEHALSEADNLFNSLVQRAFTGQL